MTVEVSPRRRREVIDALRRGTVPANGLDLLAVGLARFDAAIDRDLDSVAGGGVALKAVRGEYGSGKTFFTRWVAERAIRRGMAATEVQISETETPLHRLETVYRRITEGLRTASFPASALRAVVDVWLYTLESDVNVVGRETSDGAVEELLERRLAQVSTRTPVFAQVLRGYRRAQVAGEMGVAEGLIAWLGGEPHVAASTKRWAGVRGDLDHFGALGFLQGLLTLLRDAGHPGLLVVLDEVETLQRARGDTRDRALNALRQLIDEMDSGRFPGLFLLITGTPAFFDGPSGISRLPPLAQRVATDFSLDPRFDNPRAVQIRLPGFDELTLVALGVRVRDLYADGAEDPDRIRGAVDDAYLAILARAVSGSLGGRTGVAPRIFLKKLVGEVLDRVDQFTDFDPRKNYKLTLRPDELSDVERNALVSIAARTPDDVRIDL